MSEQFNVSGLTQSRASKIQIEVKEIAQPTVKNITSQVSTDGGDDGSDLSSDSDGSDA